MMNEKLCAVSRIVEAALERNMQRTVQLLTLSKRFLTEESADAGLVSKQSRSFNSTAASSAAYVT